MCLDPGVSSLCSLVPWPGSATTAPSPSMEHRLPRLPHATVPGAALEPTKPPAHASGNMKFTLHLGTSPEPKCGPPEEAGVRHKATRCRCEGLRVYGSALAMQRDFLNKQRTSERTRMDRNRTPSDSMYGSIPPPAGTGHEGHLPRRRTGESPKGPRPMEKDARKGS